MASHNGQAHASWRTHKLRFVIDVQMVGGVGWKFAMVLRDVTFLGSRVIARHHKHSPLAYLCPSTSTPPPPFALRINSLSANHRKPTRDITMAGPKYQNVPQRDSLDEAAPSYSQAPPSYQAQANDPQAALLSGVPRGEDDNLPDDFKFGGMVAEATLDIRMAFIRKVYAIL
jgi:hypothetical protein